MTCVEQYRQLRRPTRELLPVNGGALVAIACAPGVARSLRCGRCVVW